MDQPLEQGVPSVLALPFVFSLLFSSASINHDEERAEHLVGSAQQKNVEACNYLGSKSPNCQINDQQVLQTKQRLGPGPANLHFVVIFPAYH